jgi:hypothetical protein
MAEELFSDNLLRAIFAQLHFQSAMITAREMFGKGYFALGVSEKASVDQMVLGMVSANYQHTKPEALATHKTHEPIGFRAHEHP